MRTTCALCVFACARLLIAPALAQDGPAIRTGPEAGEKIPAFSLPDQNGRIQTFDSLKKPNGLLLAFVRSADW
jgi:hypothetical protein